MNKVDLIMDEAEFQKRVTAALQPLTNSLTSVLQKIINHDYPPEVVAIFFEVFTESFTCNFPVRAFFVDENNTEFFIYENGKAKYPSPVDPRLLDIPKVFDISLCEELEKSDEDADYYTLAGMALIPWFADCWEAAGGLHFKLGAYIQLHDDEVFYDLINRE